MRNLEPRFLCFISWLAEVLVADAEYYQKYACLCACEPVIGPGTWILKIKQNLFLLK